MTDQPTELERLAAQIRSLEGRLGVYERERLAFRLGDPLAARLGMMVSPTATAGAGPYEEHALIAADAITAREIVAGTITANEIAAGAISADKLSVGANVGMGSNAVVNSSFEDHVAGVASGWTPDWQISGDAWGVYSSIGPYDWSKSGSRMYQVSIVSTTNDGSCIASKSFPVAAGEAWHFEVSTLVGSTTTDGFYFSVFYGVTEDFGRNDTGVVFTDIVADGPLTSGVGWQDWKGDLTVPGGKTWCRVVLYWWKPNVATEAYFDRVIAQRFGSNVQNDGATVVIDDTGITVTDGAITVTNAGAVVIIDGTSNMFKIQATGTQTVAFGAVGVSNFANVVLTAITLSVVPAFLCTTTSDNSASSTSRFPGYFGAISTTGHTNFYARSAVYLTSGNPEVELAVESVLTAPGTTAAHRYYILLEAAV